LHFTFSSSTSTATCRNMSSTIKIADIQSYWKNCQTFWVFNWCWKKLTTYNIGFCRK
jgi:hypothetical protein